MHTGTIIYMRNVPGYPDCRALTSPLYYQNMDGSDGFVPIDFVWNGNSTPFGLRWIVPKQDHPIASCRHDYRCENAKSKEERRFADEEYKKDIGTTASWLETQLGYAGVRIGSFLGIGNNF